MPHSRRWWPWAATAAPATAHANAGIGFFLPATVVVVPALIPVVLIEGVVLQSRLKVAIGRAMWLSLVANLASTLLGAIIGFALDMSLMTATGTSGGAGGIGIAFSLVLMFPITWWIEAWVVRRMSPTLPRAQVNSAVLAANAITYAILIVLSLAFVPAEPNLARSQMTEVVNVAGVARTEAAEQYQSQRRFVQAVKEAPAPHVRRVTTETSGRIVAVINYPQSAELDGKTLVYEPELRGGELIAWHCYVPEAPLKYFPAVCRQRSAPGAAGK